MAIATLGLVVGMSVGYATGSLFWGAVLSGFIVLILVACDGFLDAILVEYNTTEGEDDRCQNS